MRNKEAFSLSQQWTIDRVRLPFKLEAPTCELFEPNFTRVFAYAKDHVNFSGNDIVHDGKVLATVVENTEVFGLKRWIKAVSSNVGRGPLLIKNPEKFSANESKVGVRNGLFVFEQAALAIRVTSGGNYVTRTVIPEYQEFFVGRFTYFMNLLNTNQANLLQSKI